MVGNKYKEGLLKYITGIDTAPALPTSLSIVPLMNTNYSIGDVLMTPSFKGDTAFTPISVSNDSSTWQYETEKFISNKFSFVFDSASVDWGTARYLAILDDTNEIYLLGLLSSPELVLAGQTLRIFARACKITLPQIA